jgi:hypothetical protein
MLSKAILVVGAVLVNGSTSVIGDELAKMVAAPMFLRSQQFSSNEQVYMTAF